MPAADKIRLGFVVASVGLYAFIAANKSCKFEKKKQQNIHKCLLFYIGIIQEELIVFYKQ